MARPLKRMSSTTLIVLQVFAAAPLQEQYGFTLIDRTGLQPGTLYPILARLEEYGWLVSWWEDVDPAHTGRPRRRYYRLSDGGVDLAREALSSAPPGLLRWAGA
ncbi:MAG: helix-turn-helix transcriptional regulator [Actinomycetota bacterium]